MNPRAAFRALPPEIRGTLERLAPGWTIYVPKRPTLPDRVALRRQCLLLVEKGASASAAAAAVAMRYGASGRHVYRLVFETRRRP